MKKRTKVWGKIKLWETSCCGIPMYPAAHKSYSLIKALTETEISEKQSDELNLEKKPKMPEETENVESEEKSEESEEEAKPEEEEKSEEGEESKEESEEKSEEEAAKSISAENMTGILADALKKAINETESQRGLVSPEAQVEKMQEDLKTKSLGELALMQGLFKSEPAIGESPVSA